MGMVEFYLLLSPPSLEILRQKDTSVSALGKRWNPQVTPSRNFGPDGDTLKCIGPVLQNLCSTEKKFIVDSKFFSVNLQITTSIGSHRASWRKRSLDGPSHSVIHGKYERTVISLPCNEQWTHPDFSTSVASVHLDYSSARVFNTSKMPTKFMQVSKASFSFYAQLIYCYLYHQYFNRSLV